MIVGPNDDRSSPLRRRCMQLGDDRRQVVVLAGVSASAEDVPPGEISFPLTGTEKDRAEPFVRSFTEAVFNATARLPSVRVADFELVQAARTRGVDLDRPPGLTGPAA